MFFPAPLTVPACDEELGLVVPKCIATFAKEQRELYSTMDPIPDEDWPPSIGRHESNLVMIEHGRDTLPGAKEAKQMQRDYVGGKVDSIAERKKEIRYEDIFDFKATADKSKKVSYDRKHYKMLIDGAPGVGKTTLCRKFCKDWGAGQILKQFSLVWLLNLREERIAKAKSLDDLFQHYNKKLLKKVLEHIEETGGEGNLLVSDGFDELSEKERTQHSLFLDIIRGKVLPKCSVIVSSRPYASQMLQQMKSITHHVEIVGFTEKQIKECIRQNITDKPKAEELIEQLKQRLDILSLCYTPLNAAITLYVYKQEEHTLPTTLTQLYTLYILHSLKRSVEIHFENLNAHDITDLKNLPDPIALPFIALCKMAYNGLQDDQLGFSTSQLPQSLQGCPGCKGTKPDLLGLMSGSKSFTGSNAEVSYQFTHLTAQEFLAAWYAAIVFSAEEQSKLFIEKAGDDRFRMMLLFLAGITGLQDTQVYQQILLKSYHQLQEQKLQVKQQQELEEVERKQERQRKQRQQPTLQKLLEQYEQKQAHEEKRQRKLQKRLQLLEQQEEEQQEEQQLQLQIQIQQLLEQQEQQQQQALEQEQQQLQLQQLREHHQHQLQQLREQQEQDMELQQILDKAQLQLQLHDMEQQSQEIIKVAEYLKKIFFLYHLIYESQNTSLSPILARVFASAVQQDGKLELYFGGYDLFQCTVVAYFLSTCNFPWKHLELNHVTDEKMEVIYRVCCEHAGSSDVRGAQNTNATNPPPFLKDTQELSLLYRYGNSTPPPKPTSFSYLLNMHHTILKRLEIIISEHYAFDIKECEYLQEILKTNTSLQYLKIGRIILSDLTAEHIAAWLVHNHSLKELYISENNITSVGATSIFRALVSNTTLESLDMSHNDLQSTPNSPSLPTSTSNTSSLSPPSQLLAQPTPALSTTHCQPLSPSPTPHDGGVGAAMADMLSHNSTLTELNVSGCDLTPQSCVSMFIALKHNSSLKKLYISGATFDQAASEALADMLSHNSTLTELNVSWCGLTPQSCVSMFIALKHNSSLKKLDISGTTFDQAASETLADMVSCNQSLTELDISRCRCQPKALARGLLHNTTLTKVTVLYSEEKPSIMAALEDLRREGGHTQQPDPEVARCEQVLRYVCDPQKLSFTLIHSHTYAHTHTRTHAHTHTHTTHARMHTCTHTHTHTHTHNTQLNIVKKAS